MQKQEVREKISFGKWMVEFTKVDGSKSTMECTLDSKFIPVSEEKQEKSRIADNEGTLRVYSLDRQGWRSFRVANVIKLYRSPDNL